MGFEEISFHPKSRWTLSDLSFKLIDRWAGFLFTNSVFLLPKIRWVSNEKGRNSSLMQNHRPLCSFFLMGTRHIGRWVWGGCPKSAPRGYFRGIIGAKRRMQHLFKKHNPNVAFFYDTICKTEICGSKLSSFGFNNHVGFDVMGAQGGFSFGLVLRH